MMMSLSPRGCRCGRIRTGVPRRHYLPGDNDRRMLRDHLLCHDTSAEGEGETAQGDDRQLQEERQAITVGGIHGVVVSCKDDEVTLKVDESLNVKIRVTRSAIAHLERGSEGESKEAGA